ncbi:MAG TPA: efflux RND transporter periplasmic adaptor subunit, partial [Pirellulales bacterium]|nr:efflux RND transporter periplasmic adaptor subunit [Pirellulales bacterium]
VDRIDLMRVVVRVPDRDVPFTQPGDPSRIVFDALPSTSFSGKVARVSATEDHDSRTMRVEIDVPNDKGIIRDGMYGQVEIQLEAAAAGVTIPSACIFGNVSGGKAKVYVVEGNKVRLVDIQTGKDTGAQIEVLNGLTTSQQIVVKPPTALAEGMTVDAVAAVTKSSGH